MKTAYISTKPQMNCSIVLVCHIILKRMKSLDYAVGNKKKQYDLAEEIARIVL